MFFCQFGSQHVIYLMRNVSEHFLKIKTDNALQLILDEGLIYWVDDTWLWVMKRTLPSVVTTKFLFSLFTVMCSSWSTSRNLSYLAEKGNKLFYFYEHVVRQLSSSTRYPVAGKKPQTSFLFITVHWLPTTVRVFVLLYANTPRLINLKGLCRLIQLILLWDEGHIREGDTSQGMHSRHQKLLMYLATDFKLVLNYELNDLELLRVMLQTYNDTIQNDIKYLFNYWSKYMGDSVCISNNHTMYIKPWKTLYKNSWLEYLCVPGVW